MSISRQLPPERINGSESHILRVHLQPGQGVSTEPGSLMYTTEHIELRTHSAAGKCSMLSRYGRMLMRTRSGRTLFMTDFHVKAGCRDKNDGVLGQNICDEGKGSVAVGDKVRARNVYIDIYIRMMHTYVHTYVHTDIHTYIHIYIHSYMHACMHAYIHAYMHAYVRMYMHTNVLNRLMYMY